LPRADRATRFAAQGGRGQFKSPSRAERDRPLIQSSRSESGAGLVRTFPSWGSDVGTGEPGTGETARSHLGVLGVFRNVDLEPPPFALVGLVALDRAGLPGAGTTRWFHLLARGVRAGFVPGGCGFSCHRYILSVGSPVAPRCARVAIGWCPGRGG